MESFEASTISLESITHRTHITHTNRYTTYTHTHTHTLNQGRLQGCGTEISTHPILAPHLAPPHLSAPCHSNSCIRLLSHKFTYTYTFTHQIWIQDFKAGGKSNYARKALQTSSNQKIGKPFLKICKCMYHHMMSYMKPSTNQYLTFKWFPFKIWYRRMGGSKNVAKKNNTYNDVHNTRVCCIVLFSTRKYVYNDVKLILFQKPVEGGRSHVING